MVVSLTDIFQLCILVHNYLRFILYPVLEWNFLGVITSPIFILFPFLPEFSLFICVILVSVHSICTVAHAVCFKSIHPLSPTHLQNQHVELTPASNYPFLCIYQPSSSWGKGHFSLKFFLMGTGKTSQLKAPYCSW